MPDIPEQVRALLAVAVARQASDIHIDPAAADCEIRMRVDGLMQTHARVPTEAGAAIVSRLMVLAQLLTYRRDVPQEGKASVEIPSLEVASVDVPGVAGEHARRLHIEVRISIMPTTHGLRAAVRLPAELSQPKSLEALDLDPRTLDLIDAFIRGDSGVLAIVGPAGSGKTTTAYAILEAIRKRQPGVSIVSLEDPVERDLPGVTQIQVEPFGQLTYAIALRSMLRQDPQVLMLGEIRDAETASIAMQAGLSGHRLICTLHAADAAQAVSRLLEMRLEPYQISSSLFGVISQRLLRRKIEGGYRGRFPVGEAVRIDEPLRRLIAGQAGSDAVRSAYRNSPGFISIHHAAQAKIDAGLTDAAEVERVLGRVPLN